MEELRIQKTRLTNAGTRNRQVESRHKVFRWAASARLVGMLGVGSKTCGSTSSHQWVCCKTTHCFVMPSDKYGFALLGAQRLRCHWRAWSSSLPAFSADDCAVGQFSLLTWWKINLLLYILFWFGNFQMGWRGHPTYCVLGPVHGREWKCISGMTGRAGKPFFLTAMHLNWLNTMAKLQFFTTEHYCASLAWQWLSSTNF